MDAVIKKLDQQALLIEKQNDRLSGIEHALSRIAVQEEKISNLQEQLSSLWKKYDRAFGPDGTISHIVQYQASCPRHDIRINLARQWIAISAIVALIGAIKIWG